MRRIATLLGLSAVLLTASVAGAATPDYYPLPAGYTTAGGATSDGDGNLWLGVSGPAHVTPGGSQSTPTLARVTPSKDGGAWLTEKSTTNQNTGTGPALAMQNGQTALSDQRYDAEPSGVAVDATGAPWFVEEEAGLPGYRIATWAGGVANPYSEYLLPPCSTTTSQCSGVSSGTSLTDVAYGGNGEINTNQICVGPPQARCSLVYLVREHEYVTGFPSSLGASTGSASAS